MAGSNPFSTVFNSPASNTPPTAQQLGATVAGQIVNGSAALAKQLIDNRIRLYNAVWKTPGVLPNLIIAAMGTSAASIFAEDAALLTYLKARMLAAGIDQAVIDATLPGVPAEWVVTFNQDGSGVATLAPPAQA